MNFARLNCLSHKQSDQTGPFFYSLFSVDSRCSRKLAISLADCFARIYNMKFFGNHSTDNILKYSQVFTRVIGLLTCRSNWKHLGEFAKSWPNRKLNNFDIKRAGMPLSSTPTSK